MYTVTCVLFTAYLDQSGYNYMHKNERILAVT